jgi:hypothetical protein
LGRHIFTKLKAGKHLVDHMTNMTDNNAGLTELFHINSAEYAHRNLKNFDISFDLLFF